MIWTTSASIINSDLSINVAYSLRKLNPNYGGNCIKLRRGSDDALSDFGFDSNGYIDTATIETWLGGATAYVHTLYDQFDSKNAIQSTNANQPTLVFNAINTTKAVINFTSGSSQYLTLSSAYTTSTTYCYFVLYKCASPTVGMSLLGNTTTFQLQSGGSNALQDSGGTLGTGFSTGASFRVLGLRKSSSTFGTIINSTSVSTSTAIAGATLNAGYIGRRHDGSYFNGYFVELLMAESYPSDTQMLSKTNVMNSYYSVF